MKIKCLKQNDGEVGMDGQCWPVKKGVAEVPDESGARLCQCYPDEFQPAETAGKEGDG